MSKKIAISDGSIGRVTRWTSRDLQLLQSDAANYRALNLLSELAGRAEQYRRAVDSVLGIDEALEGPDSLVRHLVSVGIRARLMRLTENLIYFQAPLLGVLPKLPRGYGYKGGSARLALQTLLYPSHKIGRPRDFDLVRIGPAPAELDAKLASRIMGEDFGHGHGVEAVLSLESYFDSRDLTVNEVVLFGNQLILTKQCLKDTLENVLRPTKHLVKDGELPALSWLKMVRLQAEIGESAKIEWHGAISVPTAFQICVHLSRAIEQGTRVAERFVQLLSESGHASQYLCPPFTLRSAVASLANHSTEGAKMLKKACEPGRDVPRPPRRVGNVVPLRRGKIYRQ